MEDRKEHRAKVYATKQPHEVSWTQKLPKTSLEFVHSVNLPKTASIIDIGGGAASWLTICLTKAMKTSQCLTSARALAKAKQRLGDRAAKVKWIVSDITEFNPSAAYDLRHDRAAYHFLNTTEDIKTYLTTAKQAVKNDMIIGTFSGKCPQKCSGLDVRQYSEEELQKTLQMDLKKSSASPKTTPHRLTLRRTFYFATSGGASRAQCPAHAQLTSA